MNIKFYSYLKGRRLSSLGALQQETFYNLLYEYWNNIGLLRKIIKWKWEKSISFGDRMTKNFVSEYMCHKASLDTFILYYKHIDEYTNYSNLFYRNDPRFIKIIYKKLRLLDKRHLDNFWDRLGGFNFVDRDILGEHIEYNNIRMCKFIVKRLNIKKNTEYCDCGTAGEANIKNISKYIELYKLKLIARRVPSTKCDPECNFHVSVIDFDHETNTKYKLVESISKRFTTKNINKMIGYFI